MIRKLLVLGYVLGVACTLYIGVEDDNDHRRPGPVKGKIILPKKMPLSTDKPGPNVEEPGKNSKTKELTECEIAIRKRRLNDSLVIKVYVKEEIRNNKKLYNREKIAKIFNKKYGLIEIEPSENDIKWGYFEFFIPNYEKYDIYSIEEAKKAWNAILEKIEKDKDKEIEYYVGNVKNIKMTTLIGLLRTPENIPKECRRRNKKSSNSKGSYYEVVSDKFYTIYDVINKGFEKNKVKSTSTGEDPCEKVSNIKGCFGKDDPLCKFWCYQWGFYTTLAAFADANVWANGYRGGNRRIAILDEGVDYEHEDLKNNLLSCDDKGKDKNGNEVPLAHDFVDGGEDPIKECKNPQDPCTGDDCDFHGTGVASVAAAVTNNSEGMAGVAPSAKIMPFRVVEKVKIKSEALLNAINYILNLSKDDRPLVLMFPYALEEECIDVPQMAEYLRLKDLVNSGITVILPLGNNEECTESFWHSIAKEGGVVLVGGWQLRTTDKGHAGVKAGPYTTDSNTTGLGPAGNLEDTEGWFGNPDGVAKDLPKFLNRILVAWKWGKEPTDDDEEVVKGMKEVLKRIINKDHDYNWVAGTSYAVGFIGGLAAIIHQGIAGLDPAGIEEWLCDTAISQFPGYDKEKHGCGVIILPQILWAITATEMDVPYIIPKPFFLNLGNFYDPDNQKPFKIVVKNTGGGKLGQLTKENILFRTPFKKVSVDIDNEKSWLKLTEIKTIKPQQEFELTFKFDRSSINKYIINKNPDKVFVGDLIMVPEGVKEEVIIPVYVFGGKEVYEKVTEPISILVYEKDEFETRINPQPLYTTTPKENLEFELPELDKDKEYRVIATTDKNLWAGTAGKEFYWGQIIIKKGGLENKTLTIYISKYKK